MPYEFGVFVGLKYSAEPAQRRKAVLVLDREPYRYQRFLSDIAGHDIQSHDGQIELLLIKVRNWLFNQGHQDIIGSAELQDQFNAFMSDIPHTLLQLRKSEADLENYQDFRQVVFSWLDIQWSK
jgi:hypothetical protein